MRIVARYSFNHGEEYINNNFPQLLQEVEEVIVGIDAHKCKTKESKEDTMKGRILFSPTDLNKEFKDEFKKKLDWKPVKIYCEYSKEHYVEDYTYTKRPRERRPYREMDFVKNKLGVEVQFGKYAFMVYNVCAKMTIFRNLEYINCGIEIVPVRGMTRDMSTGVAYFEQFTWDLKERGVGNIDIPVLILGIDADILVTEGEQDEVLGQG